MTDDQKLAFVQIYAAAYDADKQYRETHLEWMSSAELRDVIWDQEKTYVLNPNQLESLERQVKWDSRGSI